jgi:hypothetical protein
MFLHHAFTLLLASNLGSHGVLTFQRNDFYSDRLFRVHGVDFRTKFAHFIHVGGCGFPGRQHPTT